MDIRTEIHKRIARIFPNEIQVEIELCAKLAADQRPDPANPARTIGERDVLEHLAAIDARPKVSELRRNLAVDIDMQIKRQSPAAAGIAANIDRSMERAA